MKWIVLIILFPLAVFAKPKQPRVVSGTASAQDKGVVMEVRTSDRAIINWKEFSIDSGETTRFLQPSSHSAVLNRVAAGVSQIDGLLQGNGKIYLLNPNGILIGPNGCIQAESFIASTLYLNSEDFLKNKELLFKGTSKAKIVNLGTVEAIGGDVVFIGKAIVNQGCVLAKDGLVGIAAGSEVLLKPSGMQRLFIASSIGEREEGGIENSATIEAAKAELRADGNAFRFAINQSGVIEATGTKEENGAVYLVAEKGTSVNSGSIIAKGGKVHIFGDQVGLNDNAIVDVSSDYGGGEVLLGGDFQGKNPDISNATMSVVMEDAQIFADANIEGHGGKVVVWSDDTAVMKGKIFARGGREGGDGGFVEVSGVKDFRYKGHTNTSAPNGKMGELLLDPSDITISDFAANMNINFDSGTGTYTATATTAELDTTGSMNALFDELSGGTTNITVTTASSFLTFGDIVFNDGGSWATGNNLTIIANRDIIFDMSTSVSSNSTGNITLTAGRDIIFQGVDTSVSATSAEVTMTAGRNIEFIASSSNILLADKFTLSAGNDITLGIQGSPTGSTVIQPISQDFNVTAGGDLSIFGSNSPGLIKRFDLAASVGGGLTSRFTIGGNLILEGGSMLENVAVIGGNATPTTSNMFFTVGGNVVLTGGSGSESYAQIGYISSVSPVVGDIRFESIGGSVTLTGGTDADSYAQIGHANGDTMGAPAIDATGDVILRNVGGNVTLRSNASTAIIGHGNLVTTMGGDTYAGEIVVEANGDINILPSDSAPAAIGFLLGGVTANTVTNTGITIEARNLNLIGQMQDAYVGYSDRLEMAPNMVTLGPINIETTQNTLLQGVFSGVRGSALIGEETKTSSTLTIRAGDILVTLGDMDVDGAITLAAQGTISLSDRSSITGASIASTSGANTLLSDSSIVVPGNMSFSAGQNIALSQSSNFTGSNITVDAGAIFSLTNSNVIGGGVVNATAGENIELFNGSIDSPGDILALAGDDFLIQLESFINSGAGSVILVCDNNNPDRPEIGSGEFFLDDTSMVDSATVLRLFTARRNQNTLLGPLNGAFFSPGPSFINSSTEQWDSYFPEDFGGVPFTIFYKDGLPKTIFNDIGRVISEMFQNLKIYDRLLFRPKCFLLGYDKACYDQLFLPKGMISSFDLFGDRVTDILQQYYRNYHTLYVESF